MKQQPIKTFILLLLFAVLNGYSSAQHSIATKPIDRLPNQQITKSLRGNPTTSLRGSGICFTPNKGQIADMDGKLCPDVLYKGDGGGADIYLRKTGLSYVYSNMGEVMYKVNEQVEELRSAFLKE